MERLPLEPPDKNANHDPHYLFLLAKNDSVAVLKRYLAHTVDYAAQARDSGPGQHWSNERLEVLG